MIITKRLGGVLNKDDKPSDLLPFHHTSGRNIRFTGGANGLTAENVKGTIVIDNAYLPAGTNECIGSFYDQVKQRIFWFNYNSNGHNGIYQYSIQTETVSKIFVCGTDSAIDVFEFSLNFPVTSAVIVYRPEGEGDLIYWTDGNTKPKYLNIDTVSTEAPMGLGTVTAAKYAPLIPPTNFYGDDVNFNANNLRKKLFRFIYRWKYKNGERSTWSPISKASFSADNYDPTIQNDITKSNYLTVVVYGGGDDYKTIEIAAQNNINNTWSDFYLLDSLDRTQYNIPAGDPYNYRFYNDGVYAPIAPEETDLYFSWIPDKANTLELLNGNVLIYGGLTDGYDKIAREDIDVVITTGLSAPNIPSLSAAMSGLNVFTLVVGEVTTTGVDYNVQFSYSSGAGGDASPKNVTYTTMPADTRLDIALGLKALLEGNNIQADSLGGGVLRVLTSTGSGTITGLTVSVSSSGTEAASRSWRWSSPQRLGLIYFDEYGKTNGVVSFVSDSELDTTDFAFTTPSFDVSSTIQQVPIVSATINHLPPTWATSYQWVRTDLTPKFLYWVTNDYQTDTDYLYICIQNLYYQNTKNTGFVPSYEFAEGDRVKIMASYTGGNFNPYNLQLDMEILGTVTRTMNSPASDGMFLKVAKPTTLPSAPYQAKMLIEIYTPKQNVNDAGQVFFEWGEMYDIYNTVGGRYHRGGIEDQTATQPATFQWFDGDVYYRGRRFYQDVDSTATVSEYFMDANYSDYFESAVNSNGRGWVIDENVKEEYNPVLLRWGGKFQSGTNINQLNIFRPNDFDEIDRAKGDIRRLKTRDRILRIFQDRGVGQHGVYARFIQNNEGVSDLVTTNEIITINNIQYYQGTFGLSGYPTNLCSSPIADYFTDVITGRGIRLGNDGMTDLGVLYKGQYYFPQLVVPYNKTITRANGSNAKVMAFFDSFDGDFHTVLQGGTVGGETIQDSHFSFNESRNGYCCDSYDYTPEFAISVNDTIFSWKSGSLYKHTKDDAVVTFYGTQYPAEITVVFNEDVGVKKSWNSIAQVSNTTWACPEIYGNTMSYGSQRQETNLVEAEFTVLESMPTSAIKRDAYSRGGKFNGGFMKGNWLSIKLQKQNASNLVTLSEVIVRVTDSPVNRL